MLAIKPEIYYIYYVLFLLFLPVSNCDRRIRDGEEVTSDKKYVVYLVKAPISPRNYDSWLCGGALVSREFIITSAACVEDVEFLYAIAGYKKYVTDANLDTDPCTKSKKKKVIYTCTPVAYELKYDKLQKWAYIDIALVKVESPYDFNDATYQVECSYIPTTIPINYEVKYQEPGTDAMVLGWGHKTKWRQSNDNHNYNQETLNYASTLIEDKETCKKQYEVYPNMSEVIDQYMICTLAQGNINDAGETILKSPPTAEGCTTNQQKLMGFEGISCEDDAERGDDDVLMDNTRREGTNANKTYSNSSRIKSPVNRTTMINRTLEQTRRSGICQNDHGGPLVTWVGSHEVLIGIASVFKVSEESLCIGPYLYTSTQCNGAFLDCVLTTKDLDDPEKTRRSASCDSPPSEKGYDTVERHISWMYHPSGPSDNERKAANLKYAPGMQDKYSQERDNYGNKYSGNDRYKNYERHAPERYGAGHHGVEKYGVDKNAPVKFGNKYGADKYGADKHGAEKYGAEKYGAEKHVAEKYGAEKHGPEKFGAEKHGAEKYGAEKYGAEKYGAEKYGAEKHGADKYGVEKHGPDSFRENGAERYKSDQLADTDRYRSDPNPENEQLPSETNTPNEKFIMRPQRPLHD